MAFRGVRVSKFRHVYGQSSRREQCYEGLRVSTAAHDSQFCAVNPKFIAVVIEVAGGGAFQVLPLRWTGKVDYHFGRVSGHNGAVTDLKWSPFNDNILASSSDDGTVRLWHVPDEGVRARAVASVCELVGHGRRVSYVEWHPTADNVLASVGLDCRILLWNVATAECLVAIDCHPDTIHSLSFNLSGSLMATTCKDKELRVLDARSGAVIRQGHCHDGAKASKVTFLGDREKLVTAGFSRASRRQLAVWDQHDLSGPLQTQDIDASSGVLFPIYDGDLGLLYVAGKGDGNIRYFEVCDSHPWLHYLSELQSRFPQRGLGVMPKRGLNVALCEIFRFYKIHTTQLLVEPVSFIVPRKSDTFQRDLYPPTTAPTAALTADEWLCGVERQPVRVSMRSANAAATSKPVQLKRLPGADSDEQKALLVLSDANNDRKFRFLSEVTRPDYREVTLRDDYPDIIKQQQLRDKVFDRARQSSESGDSALSSPRHTSARGATARSQDDDTADSVSPPKSPAVASAPPVLRVAPSWPSPASCSSSGHSPKKIRRISDEPIVDAINADDEQSRRSSADVELPDISAPPPSHRFSSPLPIRETASPRLPSNVELPERSTTPRSSVLLGGVRTPQSPLTRPGSISGGALRSRNSDRSVLPPHQPPTTPRGLSVDSAPRTPLTQSVVVVGAHNGAAAAPADKPPSEVHRLYAEQCRRVRELLVMLETKDKRMQQLEADAASMAAKLERNQAETRRHCDDMDSLRYEIDWKDRRIAYLETRLSSHDAADQTN